MKKMYYQHKKTERSALSLMKTSFAAICSCFICLNCSFGQVSNNLGACMNENLSIFNDLTGVWKINHLKVVAGQDSADLIDIIGMVNISIDPDSDFLQIGFAWLKEFPQGRPNSFLISRSCPTDSFVVIAKEANGDYSIEEAHFDYRESRLVLSDQYTLDLKHPQQPILIRQVSNPGGNIQHIVRYILKANNGQAIEKQTYLKE